MKYTIKNLSDLSCNLNTKNMHFYIMKENKKMFETFFHLPRKSGETEVEYIERNINVVKTFFPNNWQELAEKLLTEIKEGKN